MKTRTVLVLAAAALAATTATTQEHFTQGPVWVVSYYRIGPDQFDAYMKYVRSSVLPQGDEAKKQGLVLESKMFLKFPDGPDDWDVAFAALFRSAADALDYSKERDDKGKALAEKHFKTADEDKQREAIKPRLEMRRYLGTRMLREVTLKPMSR